MKNIRRFSSGSPARTPSRVSAGILERATVAVNAAEDESSGEDTTTPRHMPVDDDMASAMNKYFHSLSGQYAETVTVTETVETTTHGESSQHRASRSSLGERLGDDDEDRIRQQAKAAFTEEFNQRKGDVGDDDSESDDSPPPPQPPPPALESESESESAPSKDPVKELMEHNSALARRVNEAEARNIQFKTTLQSAETQLRQMIEIDAKRQERIEELEEAVQAGDHILAQVEVVKRQLAGQEEARLGEQHRHAEQLDDLQAKLGEVTDCYMVLERERGDAVNAEAMRAALDAERDAMNKHKELMEEQVRLAQQAHELETARLKEELSSSQSMSHNLSADGAVAVEDLDSIRKLKDEMERKAEMFEHERDSWKQSTRLFQEQLQMQHEELNHILKQVKVSSEAEAGKLAEAEARAVKLESENAQLRQAAASGARGSSRDSELEARLRRVERENAQLHERSEEEISRVKAVNESLREELRATKEVSARFKSQMERQLADIEQKMHAGGPGGAEYVSTIYTQQVADLQQQLRVQAQVIAEAYQREVLSLRERLEAAEKEAEDGTPGRAGTEEVERRRHERPASGGGESSKGGDDLRDLQEELEAQHRRNRSARGQLAAMGGKGGGGKGGSAGGGGSSVGGGSVMGTPPRAPRGGGGGGGGPGRASPGGGRRAEVSAVELDAVQQEMEGLKQWKHSAEQMLGALHEQLSESMQLNIELEQQARQLGDERAGLRDALHSRMERMAADGGGDPRGGGSRSSSRRSAGGRGDDDDEDDDEEEVDEGHGEEEEDEEGPHHHLHRRGVHWDEELRLMQGELHHRDLEIEELREKHEALREKYMRQSQRQHALQQYMLQMQDGGPGAGLPREGPHAEAGGGAAGGGAGGGGPGAVSGSGEYWPESAFGERPLSAPSSQHQRQRRRDQQRRADPDAVGLATRASTERPLTAPSSQHPPRRPGAAEGGRSPPSRRSPGGTLLPQYLAPSPELMARHRRVLSDGASDDEEDDDPTYSPSRSASRGGMRPQTARPSSRRGHVAGPGDAGAGGGGGGAAAGPPGGALPARPQSAPRERRSRRKRSAAAAAAAAHGLEGQSPAFAPLTSCRARRSCAAHEFLAKPSGSVRHSYALTRKWK